MLVFLSSCEDEGTIIGKDIMPDEDFLNFSSTDTLSVISYTMFVDSLESDNPETVFLGQLYDPYFGTTTAGFVTQLRLTNVWQGGNWTVDSVQMTLAFTNVSGDASAGHILRLSEIAEQIYPDSTYYSSQAVPLTGYSIETTLPQMKPDSANSIVVTLPVALGEYIIRDTTMLFHDDSIPDFRSYFRGFYFQLIPSANPVFMTMNLVAPGDYGSYKHQLFIYMHDETGYSDVMILNVDAKAKNASFSTYTHDFSTADPGKKIVHVNDGVKDTLSYVQCLNGIFTKLVVPGLEDIRNDPSFDGIVINKARLICPIHYDGSSYKGSAFPRQMYMGYYDNDDNTYLIPDYFIKTDYTSFFGGLVDTTAGDYTFNIARFVQRYLDDTSGEFKPEFQLALPEGSLQNAILKANSSATPVKFELTYTRN